MRGGVGADQTHAQRSGSSQADTPHATRGGCAQGWWGGPHPCALIHEPLLVLQDRGLLPADEPLVELRLAETLFRFELGLVLVVEHLPTAVRGCTPHWLVSRKPARIEIIIHHKGAVLIEARGLVVVGRVRRIEHRARLAGSGCRHWVHRHGAAQPRWNVFPRVTDPKPPRHIHNYGIPFEERICVERRGLVEGPSRRSQCLCSPA